MCRAPAVSTQHYGIGTSGNPYNGWVDCGVTPGVPKGCMTNHWLNPAPRIGFAFDPNGDGKWAIRGGYGIFFEHTNGNESNTESLEHESKSTSHTTSVVNISGYANLNSGLLGGAGTHSVDGLCRFQARPSGLTCSSGTWISSTILARDRRHAVLCGQRRRSPDPLV